MRRSFLVLVVCLVAGLGALPALASVVEQLTLERAVDLSDQIVVGVVLELEVLKTSSGVIYTDSSVLIHERLAGEPSLPQVLVVRHPGGVVGDLGMRVEGVPSFAVGERVLLFLEPAPGTSGSFRTIGLFQGAYTLLETESGLLVEQKSDQGALVVKPQADRLPQRIGLDELRQRIQAQVADR
jgi:hypothetical protein